MEEGTEGSASISLAALAKRHPLPLEFLTAGVGKESSAVRCFVLESTVEDPEAAEIAVQALGD